jgi:hypothetical protein
VSRARSWNERRQRSQILRDLWQVASAAAVIGHCEENAKTERSPSWVRGACSDGHKARIVPAAGRGVDVWCRVFWVQGACHCARCFSSRRS